jgi:hypothetical protein
LQDEACDPHCAFAGVAVISQKLAANTNRMPAAIVIKKSLLFFIRSSK